jgi:DNA-binding CsgD family transcriptional regulator
MSLIRSLADEIDTSGPLSQVWDSAVKYLPQMGLSKVVYMDLSGENTPLILTNANDVWAAGYRGAVQAGTDPFARNCLTGVATQWTGIGHFETHQHLSQTELDQIAQGSDALGICTGMSVTIRPDARGAGVGLNLMTHHNLAEFSGLRREFEDTWRAWCQLVYAGVTATHSEKCDMPLTRKQRDCLAYFADGLLTSEVAFKMGLSESTVEMHTRMARARLNARTRDQAVAIAVRAGML